MTETLKYDLLSGTVKKDLAELPEKMLDAAFEAADEAADFMKVLAKSYVRVDTGTLQKSIRKERGGSGKHWRVIRVRAGGYYVNPKTGKICDYAVFQEHYHPYMYPAWLSIRHFVETNISNKVLQRVTL